MKSNRLLFIVVILCSYFTNPFCEAAPTAHDFNQAIIQGDLSKVKTIIAQGFDVNEIENRQFMPLHVAVGNHKIDIINYLLDQGANINIVMGEYTALHIAVQHNRADLVGLLLARGANVNIQERFSGTTPLHRALKYKLLDIAKLLMAHGARLDIKDLMGRSSMDILQKDQGLSTALNVDSR